MVDDQRPSVYDSDDATADDDFGFRLPAEQATIRVSCASVCLYRALNLVGGEGRGCSWMLPFIGNCLSSP